MSICHNSKILFLIFGMIFTASTLAQCSFLAPYSETFDSSATPACWSNSGTWMFADINTSGFPSPNAPGIDDHTGNGGYFAWLDASSSSFGSLTSPAINDSGITTLGVSFWYYIYHHNFFPPRNFLAIDFYDGSNWNNMVDSVSTNSPYWRYYTVDLSGYTVTDSIKLRFRGLKLNGSQDILLDDIHIGELPNCLPPQTVQESSVGSSSATLNITGSTGSSWQYEYGLSGFALGTGTQGNTSSLQINLSNLQPLTSYEIYVRKICGPGDTSVWYRQEFQTQCGVYPAPFSESFDTVITPVCWANYPLTSVFNYSFSALEDHTGNGGRSAYKNRNNSAALETPFIDLTTLNQPSLVFWLKLRNKFQALPGSSTDRLVVEASADTISWTPLYSFRVLDFNWQKKILDLQNTNLGDTLAFRFVYESNAYPQGDFVPDVFLDDISIQETPNCALPSDSLYFTGIGANMATINSFQNAATQVEYGSIGFSRGNGTLASISGSTATLNNLQSNTYYTVYFRDSCSGGYGPWSTPFYFKTLCPQQRDIPYNESFNAMPFQSTDFSLACWSSYGTGNTDWVSGGSPELLTGPGGNIDGQYAFTEGDGGSTGDISYLESPWIDLSQANFPFMTFYYFMYGSDMGDLCVEIYDGTTWDTIPNFICLQGQQQTSDMQPWQTRIINMTGYSDTIKVRFKAKRGPGKYSDICVDKVSFFDTCLVPNPTASFNYNLDSLTSQGQYVSFNSSSTFTADYLWDFGDGTTDTGASVQHIYKSNGNFTVKHYALNACEVADTATDTLVIMGVGQNEHSLEQIGIEIYPNPATDYVRLDNFPGQVAQLRIYDPQGRELRSEEVKLAERYSVSGLKTGVYIFVVTTEEGERYSSVVKKR